jgi:hypothetical protein
MNTQLIVVVTHQSSGTRMIRPFPRQGAKCTLWHSCGCSALISICVTCSLLFALFKQVRNQRPFCSRWKWFLDVGSYAFFSPQPSAEQPQLQLRGRAAHCRKFTRAFCSKYRCASTAGCSKTTTRDAQPSSFPSVSLHPRWNNPVPCCNTGLVGAQVRPHLSKSQLVQM